MSNLPSQSELARLREVFEDGNCMDAADEILHKWGGTLLYIERPNGRLLVPLVDHSLLWSFHACVLLSGLVLDPWWPSDPVTLREYLAGMFGDTEITLTVDAVDYATGPADTLDLPPFS